MDIFYYLLYLFSLSIIVFSLGAGNNGMFTECCIHNNYYYYTYRMQIYNYNNYACYYTSIGVYALSVPGHGLYIIVIIIVYPCNYLLYIEFT